MNDLIQNTAIPAGKKKDQIKVRNWHQLYKY